VTESKQKYLNKFHQKCLWMPATQVILPVVKEKLPGQSVPCFMPQTSLTTRASLLIRLSQNTLDDEAWKEFVRVYGRHILRWCRRRGLSEEDAQDVAQDVLVKFWKRALGFEYDATRRFRSYLSAIVSSAIADHIKGRKNKSIKFSNAESSILDSVPARQDLIARIEAAYDQELLTIAMQQVEERVQPRTWRAFTMLALEHRSGGEVAQELGMEVNTAYVARKKVQRMIREVINKIDAGEGKSNP
jgi:RNA polymerase sigma factor (sigma-70 family)